MASDEDVQKWQSAIANHLINVKDEISLVKLQRVLQMPMVEVWLGLLLGGFTLNTCRLRGKGEGEKGKKKPLTQPQKPFPQTKF